MLTLLTLLAFDPALADEPCAGASSAIATDAVAVLNLQPGVRAKPAPQAPISLPPGTQTLADLEGAFEALSADGATISDFFALLADGQRRSLPGDVVREALDKYGVSLPFLPSDDLVRIDSDGRALTVVLDFGRRRSRKLTLPTTTSHVVTSTASGDPYNTATTRLGTVTGGGHTLVVEETLTLGISDQGLTSISGVAVKKLFSFNLDGHSEHSVGKVATEEGQVVVQTDAAGQPLVVDGHYVPDVYDDWIILEVAGRTIEIGVPALERTK